MEDNNLEYKRLISSEDAENEPLANHTHLEFRLKKSRLILFCIVFEIAHLLLVWSVYDGIQRARSPKLPEIDGREFSAGTRKPKYAHTYLLYFSSKINGV
jgi:hypothetical protein